MITTWDKISVGDFLSLPRTAQVVDEKYPRFSGVYFQAGVMIKSFWREPILEYLLRFSYIRSALALDYYRVGFFQLVTYKKATASESFLQFAQQALYATASNPFCILAILKGQMCSTCELSKRGVFEPTSEFTGIYDRCATSKPYIGLWEAVRDIRNGRFRACHIGNELRSKGFLAELKKISEWDI